MKKIDTRNGEIIIMKYTWMYTIKNSNGIVATTANTEFAEIKSKHGCHVLCKRISNVYKYSL